MAEAEAKPDPAPSPLSDPRIRFALLTVLTYAVGFGVIMPVLPELVMELSGKSLAEATTIGGGLAVTYAIFQFIFSPTMGNLGDRFGRRPVVLIALAGFAVDYAVMAFAPTILWLFIGRAIAGGLGAVFAPAQAIMADVTTRENRARAFGLLGAAFGIGFIIGPAVGGLVGEFGTRVPFFVAAALAAVTFAYGLFTFEETLPAEKRRPFQWKRANPLGAIIALWNVKGIWLIAGAILLWISAVNIYPTLWSWFAAAQYGWGPGLIGLSLVFNGLSMALYQAFVIGPVTKKLGPNRSIQLGLAAAMIGFTFYVFNPFPLLVFPIALLLGIQGIIQPSMIALMSGAVSDDRQGELLGFNSSLAALAAIIAPLVYNPALAYFSGSDAPIHLPGAPFAIAAGFALLAFLLVTIDGRSRVQASPRTTSNPAEPSD